MPNLIKLLYLIYTSSSCVPLPHIILFAILIKWNSFYGSVTLNTMTLGVKTLNIMTLDVMIFSIHLT